MKNANTARTETAQLIVKDIEEMNARCYAFIEEVIAPRVDSAINDRQYHCGVDIPKSLKPAVDIIADKLRQYGYEVRISHGLSTHISIGWR